MLIFTLWRFLSLKKSQQSTGSVLSFWVVARQPGGKPHVGAKGHRIPLLSAQIQHSVDDNDNPYHIIISNH